MWGRKCIKRCVIDKFRVIWWVTWNEKEKLKKKRREYKKKDRNVIKEIYFRVSLVKR